MILDFSNFKEEEESPKDNIISTNIKKTKMLDFLQMKKNIMDLIFHNDLESDNIITAKTKSEPHSNQVKKISKKILKDTENNNINVINENNIQNNKSKKTKTKNKKEKKYIIESTTYYNQNESNDKNQEKILYKNSFPLDNKEKINNIPEIDDINNNFRFSKDNNSVNNSENNAQKYLINSKNNEAINNNGSNNNINIPFYNLEETSSLNSCKNVSSSKNKNNTNNRISFFSSSSFGKNFVLKSEVCKSTKNKEIKNNRNNYSDNNPIMNYYNGDNFGNFYLFTDKKSQEEIDGYQYINFFPKNEKEIKNKDMDIMRCIYTDNKIQKIQGNASSELLNENSDNNINNDIFNLNKSNNKYTNDKEENKESKIDFENLNLNNNDSYKNKSNSFVFDDVDNMKDIFMNSGKNESIGNKIELDKNNEAKSNNNDNNSNNIMLNNNIIPLPDNIKFMNINNFNPLESNKTSNFIPKDNNQYSNINNNNIMSNGINLNVKNNNNINDGIFLKDINNNGNDGIQINMPDINFKINYGELKEFKLNPDILNEISNLNQNYFYYQKSDNYFNVMNNENRDFNNEMKFNLNNMDNNYKNNNIFNSNYISESKINRMNLLPLNKSFYDYTEEELLQYAIPLIKDQSGCRFLQEKLKSNKYFVNEKLFPHIQNNLKELACDSFGNYFLQVLLDILSYDNLIKILDLFKKDFTSICTCSHGTRVIQKLVEIVSSDSNLLNKFINNINMNDLGIIFKSPYGNHIMQKYLIMIHSPEHTEFIYNYICENFMEIARTKHGVCVIQKCVSEGDEKKRAKIYELIMANFEVLIKDQFGNYLIQYILINTKSKEKLEEIMPIIKKIEDNLIYYCKSQFSSNVIEKCFENGENYVKEYFLEYLLSHFKDNIIELLLNPYGIYIIQKALNSNSIHKMKLCEVINEKSNELKNINLNDFKYKEIVKIINSSKELGKFFFKSKDNNNTFINSNNAMNKMNYNHNHKNKNKNNHMNYKNQNNQMNYYNNEEQQHSNKFDNNNPKKNKRGKKYYGNKY